ncbi:TniQ family protein [Sedimentitalea sp. XS_ASV28]
MTIKPLPFRPPPARDELLSSWINRLAKANIVRLKSFVAISD